MKMRLTHVTVVVKDQEEALRWYTEKLGFEKRADDSTTMPGLRWLTVAPQGQTEPEIVLNQPDTRIMGKEHDEMMNRLRSSIGKNPTWVLWTDDCMRTYEELVKRGVKFPFPPQRQPWGLSAVFEDLYGNPYNLLEPPSSP